MVAAPSRADTAGTPGHCCIPGCGNPAPTQLCRRCFAVYADEHGTLPAWVLAIRREATRQAVAQYRALQNGHHLFSYERLERYLAGRAVFSRHTENDEVSDSFTPWRDDARYLLGVDLQSAIMGTPAPPPRRLHRKGAQPPPVAPQVTDVASGPDALALLRRYSPSGVPLDMPAFLALLGDIFGWPPPGTIVDQRHREALIDLYEMVYEA